MKVKTFILTFLMMMSSPFLFGQHWVDPDLGTNNTMPISATITLDDELQTDESYQVAAFHGNTLLEVQSIIAFVIPNGGGTLYHVDMDIPYVAEKTQGIYFKLFNGTNEYVSSTKINWDENGYLHTNPLQITFQSVAQIEGTEYDVVYSSLQEAIDAAANDDVVTLLNDNKENVTVVQAPNVAFTIDGAEKTMSGTITVNGKSQAYATAGLTIKNVNFDATNISKDASINLGDGKTTTRYTNGVTVQDCDFEGDWLTTGEEKGAIKNYTGGCKNLKINHCTASSLHSLAQLKGVDGLTVSEVIVSDCKNGVSVGTSTNVAISSSQITATGYGVRADGSGAYEMTLTDNAISAELPVVVRKAEEVAYDLTIAGNNNNFTVENQGNNPEGYQVVFTTGDDGTYLAPTTGQFLLSVPENFNVYPVYVAQVGNLKYTSVVTAINEAADGATVQLLPGTIEEYVYPWPESNHSKEKSITIIGAENFGTTLKGGMYLGYDDSQCREHNIVVKGINFTGKGLTVACQQNVTIDGNKFNDITEGRAIAVVGKNINSVVKDNVIDNVAAAQGIELRNTLTATVEGNIISNTGHNALQITSQVDATASEINVTNNTMSYWGKGGEGRAMRINDIVTANINGNVMTHTAAPEEFVKVTGATNLDASKNYWNGESPLTDGMFTGVEGDLVPVLVSYYRYADKTDLVTLAPSVAKIGDVYYQSLQAAINAATEGQTVTVIKDVELENTVTVAAGKVVTLDLNGKVVSYTSDVQGETMITNNGNLTVTDNTEAKEGKIAYIYTGAADSNYGKGNYTFTNQGVLSIENVEVTVKANDHEGKFPHALYVIQNAKTLTIDNAQIINNNNVAIRQWATAANENVVTVKGENAEITGVRAIWIQLPSSNTTSPVVKLNIENGTLTGLGEGEGENINKLAIYSYSYGQNMQNVEINISGGTFNGDIALTGGSNKNNIETLNITNGIFNGYDGDVYSYGADEKAVGAISITGGTFSSNYAEKYALDNGYVFVENSVGKYELEEFEGFDIPNLDRLIAFRNAVNAGNTFANKTVTVTADIDLDEVANWTPIGTLSTPFSGTFDGGDKTISNLKVDGGAYAGLFGYANSATIKNVKIENANVKGTECVGVIAGNVHSTSLIDNCHVSGNIKVEGQTNVGGIVGKYYTKVTNSSVIGDGVTTSYVKGVYYAADYEGDNIGGIMGHGGENNTFTNNTVKKITISGTRKVGGIVGVTDQNTDVTNCVVENVKIKTTAEAQYAEDNKTKAGHASLVGSYTSAGANDNGTVTNCLVKNVEFVNTNNVVASFGPITGGARGGSEAMLNPTGVTASGNLVYMTTVTGSNNLFLMKAVAKIDETDYYTLDEAIAAANNQTVTVLENVELRNTLTIEAGKTVTLDLNGKTISVAITEQLTKSFAAIKNKGTLTVKDSGTEGKISVSYGGSSFGYGIGLYTISNEGGVLNIESGIIENTATVATSMYDAIDNNSTLGETVLNISGGEVRCAQYIGVRQFANSTTKDNIVNVTGGKVLGGNTSIWMQNPGSNQPKATIAISEDANIEGRLLAGESEEFVFAVTGGTFTTDVTDFCAPGYVCKQNTDGTYGVFLGVAKIVETGAIYASLQAAVNAATTSQNIVLLADITENVTVSKSLTIDGANDEAVDGKFDYTGTMTANAGLTVTVQNIDFVGGGFDKSSKSTTGNYTIKNCTFEDDGDYAYAFRFKGANSVTIEDCTVKNYLYSFLYITSSTNKVSVKNVTVEDCPSYAVYFASGVTTANIENLTVKNSDNGFVINNTAKRTLNLTNCKFENVATAINHSNGADTVTCNLLGENNDFGTSALSQYATIVLAAEDATLTAPEGLNVTTSVEDYSVKYEGGVYKVVPDNVKIESTGATFATIQEAIDAAQTGDKVVLLKDVTYTWDNVILNSSNYAVLLNVSGKDITLDMNGRTISVNHQSTTDRIYAVVCIEDGAGLTFTGEGTIDVDVDDNAPKVAYMFWKRGSTGHLTIENGTFHMDNSEDSMVYTNGSEIVKVNGGTFTLDEVGTRDNGFPHIFSTQGQNAKNITVNGGTFNADVLHQYYAFEVNSSVNNALVDNGNGTWTIVTDGAVAYVTERYTGYSSGYTNEVGYATLADAVAAAHEYNYVTEDETSTVTMLQDVTLAESLTIEAGKEVILDLKGNDINVANDQVNFNINGKLTLNDETGEGVFTSRNHFVNEGAEFIVNGGTVQNVETATGGFPINLNGGSVTINGGTVQAVNNANYAIGGIGGTLVINGGTVKGNWGAVNLASGNATITDGTLEVTGTTGGHALYVAGNTEVTIEGGEFKPYNGSVASYALVLDEGNPTVNVSGGMFHKGWGCVIVYAGNLSLTGGTFGSNMVITNNDPSESADINTFCAEGYGAIANANGTWTVMPVQEQSLVEGWNWYSSYLDIRPRDLTTALGENGLEVKDQNNVSMTYDTGWGTGIWTNVDNYTLDFAKMYMINTTEACELKLAANVLNPADCPVTLNGDWNWIGYPSNVSVNINDALENLTPNDGDIIKTRNLGHAEYAWGGWIGALTHMIPGEGYMYRNTSGVEKQFIYNVESTRGTVEANYTAENNYWTPNVSKYPFNMTMTAVVDGMTDGNYEVAAFVNGEVRGSARPIYVEQLDAYVLFLTINGDEVEEMSFRLYDIDNDTEYDLNDRFNYSNNAHLGSVSEPYVFSRGTTGIGEAAMSNINIYPNPTTIGTEINLEATCDIVEVYNALGVKVAEYQNVDTIDALETAGIYVIRITNNGNVQNCRLVVK